MKLKVFRKFTRSYVVILICLLIQWIGMILFVAGLVSWFSGSSILDLIASLIGLHIAITANQLRLLYIREPLRRYNQSVEKVNRLPRRYRRSVIRELIKKP